MEGPNRGLEKGGRGSEEWGGGGGVATSVL